MISIYCYGITFHCFPYFLFYQIHQTQMQAEIHEDLPVPDQDTETHTKKTVSLSI